MKKSLIALAVSAAVITPGLALAADDGGSKVSVYGRAQVEVGGVSYGDKNENKNTKADGIQVRDNAMGRIGVKASEDLGGGLKGIAKFEFKLDTADGDSATANAIKFTDKNEDGIVNTNEVSSKNVGIALTKRELLVGLKGKTWGQFEMGRLKSEYKYKGGVKYDPFTATFLEARGKGGMSSGQWGHNSFNSYMLGWRSPKWGGLQMGLTYGPQEDDQSYTVGLIYAQPVWEVFVAAVGSGDSGKKQVDGANNTTFLTGDEESGWKLGGAFKLAGGAHTFRLQYESKNLKEYTPNGANTGAEVDPDDKNAETDPTWAFLGYEGKFGKTHLVVQVGQYESDTKVFQTANGSYKDNDAVLYYTLGAIYKFSKQTRVFGGYRVSDADAYNSDGANEDIGESVFSIGLRKDFK